MYFLWNSTQDVQVACEASGCEAATFGTERQKFAVWRLLRKFGILTQKINWTQLCEKYLTSGVPFLQEAPVERAEYIPGSIPGSDARAKR